MKSIRLTRDSVCMADDIDAPHEQYLEVDLDMDARGFAKRLLSGRYLPYVGWNATWALALGPDHVVFGLRYGRHCILPVDPETHGTRAELIDAVHVRYATQENPKIVANRIREQLARSED